MAIRELDVEKRKEASMVDLFYGLLQEAKEPRDFYDVYKEIVELKGLKSVSESDMARLFTAINIDGRFKPLGDNLWGLRSWYPVEQSDEPVITEKKKPKKKKKAKKVEIEEEELDFEEDIEEADDFDDEFDDSVDDEVEDIDDEDVDEDDEDIDDEDIIDADLDDDFDDEYDDDDLEVLEEDEDEDK